ncbi:MAG: alginate lyase family protein [Candidatus Cloacimonetes bacterium]|nr:alginate lyase family protein [Candidatus Cloacimonadota bacterium]
MSSLELSLRFRTIRYLKPVQVFAKIWLKLNRIYLNCFVRKSKLPSGFRIPILGQLNQLQKKITRYTIFDDIINLSDIDWKMNDKTNLFQYHLHYHEFLLFLDKNTGIKVIRDWIAKNSPSNSVSWDPYTISIRVVNWIKFISHHNIHDSVILNSLYLQGIWLFHQREYNLLSNHFFKNIIALLYLGYIFRKNSWSKWASHNFKNQIREQLTENGYHFEFSPTYHAIFIKDLLDAYNLITNNETLTSKKFGIKLKNIIEKSLFWLQYFSANEVYFPINDVNYQETPIPQELLSYAKSLNILSFETKEKQSDYYPILTKGDLTIVLYCAPFNPSYNPSHSHADILSVLLWFKNKSIVIDTGCFTYDEGSERNYSRSTKAHNTIEIDGSDQCELWKAFRIGRRGLLFDKKITDDRIDCSYSFQEKIKVAHRRSVLKESDGFLIRDLLKGKGTHRYKMYFHLSPECKIELKKKDLLIDHMIKISFPNEEIKLINSEYYPRIYQKHEKSTVEISGSFSDEKILETIIIKL